MPQTRPGETLSACRVMALALLAASTAVVPFPASAHGFAGARFFAATIATDDPFVADELSLPTITWQKNPGDDPGAPATRETDVSLDFARRITSDFGLEASATWKTLSVPGTPDVNGFDNLAVGAKYPFFESDAHEAIASVGVDWDIGNSGAKRVGAESISTVTPTLFFGTGMGDLPDTMSWLRPVAVTGLIGVGIPSRASTSTQGDDGTLDRGSSGATGTVDPGLLWDGRYVQLAVEAAIPVNRASGSYVGWTLQLHFFLDDLFPKAFGHPLIGT